MYDHRFRLVLDEDGTEVAIGERIVSFRGETWEFLGISNPPDAGRSGRVLVRLGPADRDRELYPTVFNATIVARER